MVEERCAADGGARALLYLAEGETEGVGALELCRPAALNSLSAAMIAFLYATLQRWRTDVRVAAVVLYPAHVAAGEGRQQGRRPAFCAGGDLKEFVEADVPRFTFAEYRLDLLVRRFPRPLVALVDGVVMGGGAGVGLLAQHRVLTPHSLFAMPEARIGWVTDCGGSWLLSAPRVDCGGGGVRRLGHYLGMTGARCGPADMALAGLGDWYSASDQQTAALLQALLQRSGPVERTLAELLPQPLPGRQESSLWPHAATISRCFSADCAEEVLRRLEEAAHSDAWAAEAAALVRQQCPTSLKVVHELLSRSEGRDIGECLTLEYRAAVHLAGRDDLQEGVAAVLVRKDGQPRFRPASLAAVPDVRNWFLPMQQADLLWHAVPGVGGVLQQANL